MDSDQLVYVLLSGFGEKIPAFYLGSQNISIKNSDSDKVTGT